MRSACSSASSLRSGGGARTQGGALMRPAGGAAARRRAGAAARFGPVRCSRREITALVLRALDHYAVTSNMTIVTTRALASGVPSSL
jgi:hypothetical protein